MSDILLTGPDDVGDALIHLDRRLREVEGTVGDPTAPVGSSGAVSDFPDGITIGDTELLADVAPVLNLTASGEVHTFDVHGHIEWERPNLNVVEFEVEYAQYNTELGVYEMPDYRRTMGEGLQLTGLLPSTTYGVRVYGINRIGKRSTPTPAVGWLDFSTGEDTTIPPQPLSLTMVRGASMIIMKVTASTEPDVAEGRGFYEFQADTANTFDTANLITKRDTAYVSIVGVGNVEAAYYGRARYIDQWGNEGPWSTIVGPVSAGGVTETMIVGDFSAARITYGQMSGDRLQANTADISILKTSSLTAADITLNGGSLRAGSPPTTGLLINSQGIRLYQGGVQTFIADASTGTVTVTGNISGGTITIGSYFSVDANGVLTATNGNFTGSISGSTITGGTFQTASSGARLVIDTSETNRIRFYNSEGTLIGRVGIQNNGGVDELVIGANTTSIRGADLVSTPASFKVSANSIELFGNVSVPNLSATGTISNSGYSYINTSALRIFDTEVIDGVWNLKNIDTATMSNATVSGALSAGSVTTNSVTIGGTTAINSSRQGNFAGLTYTGDISPSGAVSVVINQTTSDTGLPIVRSAFGALRATSSSERVKANVKPVGETEAWDSSKIHDLQVVTWNSRLHKKDLGGTDDPRKRIVGLIAEQVNKVLPELVYKEKGKVFGISEAPLMYLMLQEIQKLRRDLDEIKSTLAA